GKNPGGKYIWDIDGSSDGKIYGGTYEGRVPGVMFEYDIASNTFKSFGALHEEQEYVRGTGVSDRYAYGGTGSTAYLYKFDRETYEKTEIPLSITGASTMISNIWEYNGVLFVVHGTSLLILDAETYE